MKGSRLSALPGRLAIAFLFLAAATCGRAQYEITLKLNKDTYLTYEGVEAAVTIMNRSGADVVMGGPNNTPWLSFDITDPHGRAVPPMRFATEENIVFKAGTTLSRKVALSDQFTFSELGNYVVVANVYHPPSQQYFASARTRAAFMDTKPFWSKAFGVPLGLPGAGQIRRYDLSLLKDLEHTQLYVRLVEDRTGLTLATYSLGNWIRVADPQLTLDKDNRLHALFMTAPHIYVHLIVDTQGALAKRLYYREIEANRPRLVVDPTQGVLVQGGAAFDPSIPTPTRPGGRSVKDRPARL